MAITSIIHTHSQGDFPPDSHKLRPSNVFRKTKEAFNGLHLHASQFDFEALLLKPG
jgi:hypothetical protein